MNLTEAVETLTRPYRDECVYSNGADDYDADNLWDWSRESVAAEIDESEDGEPKEYDVDGDAIYEVVDGMTQVGSQPTVKLRTMRAWNPGTDDQIEDAWPDEATWRAWAVAR